MVVDPCSMADPTWRALILALGRRGQDPYLGGALVDWALQAMEAGWSSKSLAVLAGLDKPPNEFEVDRYLAHAAEELGMALPEPPSLRDLHALAVASAIVARDLRPYEGAKELYRLWLTGGASDDLTAWCGLEDEYELARDRIFGEVAEVEGRIVLEATRMVRAASEATSA